MELIHTFLNLVAPPFTFFSLCFFLPAYKCYEYFTSLLNSIFSENLAGKVVIITGVSSGIGEHLAYEYASRGACLALCASRERNLEDVAGRARQIGSPDVITVHGDISKVDDCRQLVEETVNHFGRLDHLVHNAGLLAVGMFEDSENITNFKSIMDTNFWGSVYTTRFAVPHLKNSRGKIVALSSADSLLPLPRHGFYNASKAAIKIFFETLSIELGSDIGVTNVTPGFIESEITQGKFLTREGIVEIDQDMRDVEVADPVESASNCAQAIVDSACRGDRYLTEPSRFRVTYWLKVFCPEVIEWYFRLFYLSRPGASPT